MKFFLRYQICCQISKLMNFSPFRFWWYQSKWIVQKTRSREMPKHGMSFELFLTQILPPIGVINVSSKFDHHEVPNTLVLNLATRWPNKCLYHRQKSYTGKRRASRKSCKPAVYAGYVSVKLTKTGVDQTWVRWKSILFKTWMHTCQLSSALFSTVLIILIH